MCNKLILKNLAIKSKFKYKIIKHPCEIFKSQCKKAKETLDILQQRKSQIELALESNPISSNLNKKLREINLDIKIPVNELEHTDYSNAKCEISHPTFIENT